MELDDGLSDASCSKGMRKLFLSADDLLTGAASLSDQQMSLYTAEVDGAADSRLHMDLHGAIATTSFPVAEINRGDAEYLVIGKVFPILCQDLAYTEGLSIKSKTVYCSSQTITCSGQVIASEWLIHCTAIIQIIRIPVLRILAW